MASLYIDRKDAQVDYESGQLRIREPGQAPRGYPLRGLERVVISGNLQLSTRLLTQLADHGVGVLLLEGRGARRYAQISSADHGDASRRLAQYALVSDDNVCINWSRKLVRARVLGMLHLLRHAQRLRPDQRYVLTQTARPLRTRLQHLGKVTQLASLRGWEGASTARYFAAYRQLFSENLGFTDRNRRPPRDPVNAALSLGYALTHAEAVRSCQIAGLDPMLGVYHQPEHGRESLACDVNELARVHIETLVWRLFAQQTLQQAQFEHHNGACFLKKDARHLFFAAYEEAAPTIRRLLRRATQHLARACSLEPAKP